MNFFSPFRISIYGLFVVFSLSVFSLDIRVTDVPINPCVINRNDKRKGELAICAVFKNEAPYLKEWIEFHRLVGVSHFYLYNNLSSDNFWTETLKPYVDLGIVELFDVPFDSSVYLDGAKTHNVVQVACYTHAINLASYKNNWLAIIDVDEFICPVQDTSLIKILKEYDYAGGLVVYWQIYGTSNIWDLSQGELLIEKLLLKQPEGKSALFKSIVKPHLVKKCVDPHWTTVEGASLVIPNHSSFSHTPNFSVLPIDVIRINHYTYRTLSFYENIKKPRRNSWGDVPTPEQEKQRLDYANSVYDPIMLRFVPALKKQMQ